MSEWQKSGKMAFRTRAELQNQAIGWLRKGCRYLGSGMCGMISTDLDVIWGMSDYDGPSRWS